MPECNCSLRTHPELARITADLAARVPERVVASRYGVNRNRLQRHKRCMESPAIAPRAVARTSALKQRLKRLDASQKAAERAGNHDASARYFEMIASVEREIAALESPPKLLKPASDEPLHFVLRHEDPPFDPLTREQEDEYLCTLLRHRAEREGTSEILLASIARTVSELAHDPLPPELEEEVHKRLDLLLKGNRREE